MKNFLLNMNTNAPKYYAFNVLYFLFLILTVVLFMLIVINRKKLIKLKENTKVKIRFIFGMVLILCYILRRGSYLYYGVYNWKYNLSLGFCNMTNILFIIYCLGGNKKIYNLCYYCAFCGPLLSILIPVINIEINNFSFINFLIIHHLIFLMNIVFAIFESKYYNFNDLICYLSYMVVYLFCTYLFNSCFNTNYNMLNQFLLDCLLNNHFLTLIIGNVILNFIVLIIVGLLMSLVGFWTLKYLNK